MEERLKYIYDDVYRWLIFAEAKNLALITIFLLILENLISNVNNIACKWIPLYVCAFSVLSICCIFMIISVIPMLNNNKIIKKCASIRYKKHKSSSNMIFYGSVFHKHIDNTYKNSIIQSGGSTAVNKFEEDLIQQIEETATVAIIKIWFFDTTIKLLLLGLMISLIISIICA